MTRYHVWRDDGGGFIAIEEGHPFCDMLENSFFVGTAEEIWGDMPERNGRYVAFLRARGKVRVIRQTSL